MLDSPEILAFLERIVDDGDPPPESPSVRKHMIDVLRESFQITVMSAISEKLSPFQSDYLAALERKGANSKDIEIYVTSAIPNLKELMVELMTDFRNSFIE